MDRLMDVWMVGSIIQTFLSRSLPVLGSDSPNNIFYFLSFNNRHKGTVSKIGKRPFNWKVEKYCLQRYQKLITYYTKKRKKFSFEWNLRELNSVNEAKLTRKRTIFPFVPNLSFSFYIKKARLSVIIVIKLCKVWSLMI